MITPVDGWSKTSPWERVPRIAVAALTDERPLSICCHSDVVWSMDGVEFMLRSVMASDRVGPDVLQLRDDNPSSVDLMGLDGLLNAIEATITHPHLDPVTVGVNSPWGGGKTTVLELLRGRLETHDDIVVVFVSPWAYDSTTDPRTALIEAVLTELEAHAARDETRFAQFRGKLLELYRRVDIAKAVKLAAKSALTLTLPDFDSLVGVVREAEAPHERGERVDLQGFREKFSELLDPPERDDLTVDEGASSIRRVVVLVDDLDRALPDAVVESLEAIKLFLSVKKMAFVIAADEQNVADSIQRRLDRSGQPITGTLYLEKIVQIPFRVPAPTLERTIEYLALLLLSHTDDPKRLREILDESRGSGETLAARLADHTDERELIALAEQLGSVLYRQTGGNPRRLKRFLNAFWIRSAQAEANGVSLSPGVYAKMMVAELLYADLFASVIGWLGSGELMDKVAEIERGEGDHGEHVLDWGRMEPSLEDADLAAYLHLAASLRGETVSDTGLPASLRQIAERLMSSSDATFGGGVEDSNALDVHDKAAIGRHLAAILRHFGDPNKQRLVCRGISVVATDDVAAATIVSELRLVDVNKLTAAAPIALAHVPLHRAVRELLADWAKDPAGSGEFRRAADDTATRA